MKDLQRFVIVALGAAVTQARIMLESEASCYNDSFCEEYSCCSVSEQFTTEKGECVEKDTVSRCKNRYHIERYIIAALFVFTIVTFSFCGLVKTRQIKAEKRRLFDIKVDHAKKEDARLARE